jgi:hypothetical protein
MEGITKNKADGISRHLFKYYSTWEVGCMYKVVLADLPPKIKGMIVKEDDCFTILLNSRLSREQNMKTYLHEKKHIERGYFENGGDVDQIERDAHQE